MLLLLIENSHIKVGTVAIGADLAYQCSLTLTCRLVSQDQCGRQVVGGKVGRQSSAATDGGFLQQKEREGVSSYQLGATSVNANVCKEIVSPADVVRVYTMAIYVRN